MTLAIDGDTLAVVAGRSNVTVFSAPFTTSATVYVFEYSGTEWLQTDLLASTLVDDGFGSSIALAGDTLAIGAIRDDTVPLPTGAVHVFTRSGPFWESEAKLAASAGDSSGSPGGVAVDGSFGTSVSLDGDVLAVGSYTRAHIFQRDSGSWTACGTIGSAPLFGEAIAIADGAGVVGTRTTLPGVAPPEAFYDGGMATVFTYGPYTSNCFGDGSGTSGCGACPCGNESPLHFQEGCQNSSGRGARLLPCGFPSIENDTLRFELIGGNASTFAILVSGDSALPQTGPCPIGSGVVGSAAPLDGLRCVGGNFLRHGARA